MEDLSYFAATDIGKTRQKNQDNWGIYYPVQLGLPDGIFIICDGMGAHKAGEIASKLAVDEIAHSYAAAISQQKVGDNLAGAIRNAHQKILAQAKQDQNLRDMGTTAVAVVVKGNSAFIGNVGDSRAYILRDNVLRQITSDHSQVNEMIKAGVISEEEAANNKHRNVLSRSLSALRPAVQVDIFEEEFQDGDLIMLCTDGLWGQVPDNVIAATLQKYSLEKSAKQLIDLSNQAGGADNVTVIIIRKGRPVAQSGSINVRQWLSEHPIFVTAIVGIVIAILALLALAFWLFGSK